MSQTLFDATFLELSSQSAWNCAPVEMNSILLWLKFFRTEDSTNKRIGTLKCYIYLQTNRSGRDEMGIDQAPRCDFESGGAKISKWGSMSDGTLKLNSHWTRHGAARHDADLIWFESRDCIAHA